MRKKLLFFIVIISCLINGCENKQSTNEWILDAQYNTVYMDNWRKGVTFNTENGIITYAEVENSKNEPKYFPLYLNDSGVYTMDDSISSTCSFTNVDDCKNLLPDAFNGLDYYKGKIYYFDFVIDENVTGFKININEADINGYNQKEKYTLIDYIPFEEAEGISYIEFHRNKIYANLYGDLYIGDLNTNKVKKIIIPGVENVWRVFMVEDTLYVTTEEYNDGSKIYYDAVLRCNLEGDLETLLYENLTVALIDENLIFHRDRQDLTWHIYNRNTNKSKKIDDVLYYYVLKYDDTYLLETKNILTDNMVITILDKNGNKIHTKEYTNSSYYNGGLLYTGGRYYVCKVGFDDKMQGYGYYEISEKGISDFIELPGKDNL